MIGRGRSSSQRAGEALGLGAGRPTRASGWRRPALIHAMVLVMTVGGVQAAGEAAGVEALDDRAGETGVKLEREIRSKGDLGGGRFFRRLTGRQDPNLFERPYGVAWRGEDLVVTDPGAGAVLRIGARGRLSSTPEDLLRSPIGVAACPTGLLVSDSVAGRVGLLDDELRLQRWIAEDLHRPTGVACFGDRFFVVETGRHRVVVFEPGAGEASERRSFRSPVEAEGLLRAEDAGVRISEVNPVVHTLGRRGSERGEFNFPTTLAVGIGSLWVGDALNFRLQRFDPESGFSDGSFGRIGDAAGEMPRLKGLAIDAEERIWVTDAYLDQVALYDEDGGFLSSLGGTGGGALEFSFPAGIAAHPDGRVAIVDSLNRRIQIVRLTGTPPDKRGTQP